MKKILLTIILVTTFLTMGSGALVAHAAACAAGATETCTVAAGADCPAGFKEVEGPPVTDDAPKTCMKTPAPTKSAEDQEQAANWATFLIWIQKFLNRLLWPLLVMIGGLMDNSLLFGNGMEERLREIWIPIRNLVNILFVIVLVGIAIYNVLGIGDENSEYSIKSTLPKIVIGIIAVNFSFLGIKVFLDVINVLTSAVFALPNEINQSIGTVLEPKNDSDKAVVNRLCAALEGLSVSDFNQIEGDVLAQQKELAIYHNLAERALNTQGYNPSMTKAQIDTILAKPENTGLKAAFEKDLARSKDSGLCIPGADKLSPQGELFLKSWNSRNAAFALALNMGKIVFYPELKVDSVKDLEKLAINTLFSVLLYLVYAASFVALFIVLLARLVVLWLGIAISPVLLLMIAAPAVKEKLGGFSQLSDQFVKNAIAPLLIALALTVGWIMLKAVQGLNSIGMSSAFGVEISKGIPIVGLSTLQDLVVALGTVGVVWLGVFAAAEGTLAQTFTDPLKGGLQTAAKWLGTLPLKHASFIPIQLPGQEAPTNYSLGEVGAAFQDITRDKHQDRLIKDLTGNIPANVDTVNDKTRVNDLTTFQQWVNSMGNNISSPAAIANIKKLETENPGLWKAIQDESGYKDEFKAFIAKPDDKDLKEAFIKANKKKNSTPLPDGKVTSATPTPAAAAATAATGGAVTQITEESPFNAAGTVNAATSTLNKDLRDAGINVFNAKLNELAGVFDPLLKAGQKAAAGDAKERTENIVKTLRIGDQAPTAEILKTQIGEPRYNMLVKTVGDETKLKALLTPPPAATPPAAATPL